MLEYARWKYILVAVVLVLALILALPNLFGYTPAMQFARKDRADIDATSQATIEKFFKDHSLAFTSSSLDQGRLTFRFADVNQQLRARDAVGTEPALTRTYATAL